MLKFISEMALMLALALGFFYGGSLEVATIYMFITALISAIISYIVERKVQKFSLVSLIILFIAASLTWFIGDSSFIKFKPTILYIFSSVSLLWSCFKKRPVMEYLFNGAFKLYEKAWYILSYRFSFFFILMAIANEIVWRYYSDETWVKFKIFIVLPITFLFIMLQIPFLIRNKLPDDDDNNQTNKLSSLDKI
jgi:intracellular septation protein